MIDHFFNYLHKGIIIIELIPILLAIWLFCTNILASRLFLNFSKKELDIIITTSEHKKAEVGLHVARATTGIGQVQGISIVSKLIGRLYRHKDINLQMSELIDHRPINDLILLGGPAKNDFTKRFLRLFQEKNSSIDFNFDDIDVQIRLNGFEIKKPNLDINQDGKIDTDYAIVICSENPFSVDKRRLILCAGFTSYGTAGAATWLFDDVLLKGYKGIKRLKEINRIKSPSFIAVLKIGVASNQIIETKCIQLFPLES